MMEILNPQLSSLSFLTLGQRSVPVLSLSTVLNIQRGLVLEGAFISRPESSQTLVKTAKGEFLLPYSVSQSASGIIEFVEVSPILKARIQSLNFNPQEVLRVQERIDALITNPNVEDKASLINSAQLLTRQVTEPLGGNVYRPEVSSGIINEATVVSASVADHRPQLGEAFDRSKTREPFFVSTFASIEKPNISLIESWFKGNAVVGGGEQIFPNVRLNASLEQHMPEGWSKTYLAHNVSALIHIENVTDTNEGNIKGGYEIVANPKANLSNQPSYSLTLAAGTISIPAAELPEDEMIGIRIVEIIPSAAKALDEMLALFEGIDLDQSELEGIGHIIKRKMEESGRLYQEPKMHHSLKEASSFVRAVATGDIDEWLPHEIRQRLSQGGKEDVITRAQNEFHSIHALYTASMISQNWQIMLFPWMENQVCCPIPMLVKNNLPERGEGQASSDQKGGQRFVVNVEVKGVGPIQFDGFISANSGEKHFHLIIRTTTELSAEEQADVKRIFRRQIQEANFKGVLEFKKTDYIDPIPFEDVSLAHAHSIHYADIVA